MWSVLDRLRSPSTRAPAGGPSARDEQYTEEGDDDDGSSIMMYLHRYSLMKQFRGGNSSFGNLLC